MCWSPKIKDVIIFLCVIFEFYRIFLYSLLRGVVQKIFKKTSEYMTEKNTFLLSMSLLADMSAKNVIEE